jgi:hypothetical protein
LFAFFIYFLPVIFRQMGAVMFVWSGTASLLVIGGFIFLIARVAHFQYKENYRTLFFVIFGIWAAMNFLYFFNIIPPIPLSLKTGAVYHSVEKLPGGGYLVAGETGEKWYEKWTFTKDIHLYPGEGVYVWSSVFAPAGLNINIVHQWQYFDEGKKEWIDSSRIPFPLTGGRDEGYRGFSKKENIFPGLWRVDIQTERGQIVGRVRFDIKIGNYLPQMERKRL